MRKAEKIVYKERSSFLKGNIKLSKMYASILRILFSFDIQGSTKIGSGVQFVHNGLGCVIHPKTKIGNNCKIYQNVTLGGNGKIINGRKVNTGGPTLEKNVAVFAGASVLGPITIGHDSIIGANAVITKDVPPNSLVIGNPAIVKKNSLKYNFD